MDVSTMGHAAMVHTLIKRTGDTPLGAIQPTASNNALHRTATA